MKRIYLLTLIFCFQIIFSQEPCPPGQICNGGVGADGFGTPASPIDMHIYLLAIVAILMIVYFARKFKTQKL